MSSTLSLSDDAGQPAQPEREHVRFQVEREHARGGLGRVLEARDKDLQRTVAIKEIVVQDPVSQARFQREAELTARLQHPGIVPIYERSAWPGGEPFYVMKMVSGRSLSEAIKASASLTERLALVAHVIDVAETIAYAHAEGVVHRDLKPSNVIIGTYGETVVIDWGIAKDLRADDTDADPAVMPMTVAAADDLTVAGSVIGTPAYMPPEQARGEAVDGRADVYAIGAMLYHVVAGAAPFDGDSGTDVLGQVKTEDPVPLEQVVPDVAPDLCTIIGVAMARDASDRYPSARELAADLERFRDGQLVGHEGPVWSVAFDPTGTSIVTAGADHVARVWDAATGASRAVLRGHRGVVYSAAFSPDGERIVTASHDQSVRVWGAADGGVRDVLRGHEVTVIAAAFSPDGERIVTGSWDQTARVWRAEVGEGTGPLAGHREEVLVAEFSRDGRQLVTWSSDNVAQLWEADSLVRRWRVDGLAAPMAVAFTADGARIAAGQFLGAHARLVDARTGQVAVELPGHGDRVYGVDVSPDGRTLVTASHDGTARLWNPSTGEPVGEPLHRDRGWSSARFSPDGRYVAMAARGARQIELWDLRARKRARSIGDHSTGVNAVAFSRDGRTLVTGGVGDHLVKVWDAATGALKMTLAGHTDMVLWVSYSPDGRIIATAGVDQKAMFWDADTGERVYELDGPAFSVDFHPDGTRIAVGGYSGYARVLRLETRSPDEIARILDDVVDLRFDRGKIVRLR